MNLTDMQRAERASRVRASLMAAMAVFMLINAGLATGKESTTMTPALAHGSWALLIVLWLIILATGGWLRLNRGVRSLMNDEVSLANRSRALQAGFWGAMLFGLALYFASFEWALGTRETIRILLDLSIAVALARYAWLELR